VKVLLIGYGSIGKRHDAILSSLSGCIVDIVTSQRIEKRVTYLDIKKVPDLGTYDYFVIANATDLHHSTLRYLVNRVKNSTILVEKPLFKKFHDINTLDNDIFVAYNLRFHPLLTRLKEELQNEEILTATLQVGQYLPSWRPGTDYSKSYSADLDQGGGVLRDLSHEIDYLHWLCGEVKTMTSVSTKISDLEIKSDDIFIATGFTTKNVLFNVTLDCLSRVPFRRMIIHTKNESYICDMMEGTIVTSKETMRGLKPKDRDETYYLMHKDVMHGAQTVCSYKEGISVMKVIDRVYFKSVENYV
jgi:predicted dehydrogenase